MNYGTIDSQIIAISEFMAVLHMYILVNLIVKTMAKQQEKERHWTVEDTVVYLLATLQHRKPGES